MSGISTPEAPRIQWGEAEIRGPRHAYRERLLHRLIHRYVRVGSRILDAGCGGGSLLTEMARRGHIVSGIEASDAFVSRVQEKIAQEGLQSRASIRRSDVTSIPFNSEAFDAVVSGEVLEHVQEDGQAVREFHRVLRPGGICILSVPAHRALWDFTDEWAGHVRRYEKSELIQLIEGNGFRVVAIRSWGFPLVRLYNRYLYVPFAKRQAYERQISRKGQYTLLSALLGKVFQFDSLFGWIPYGIGWLLVAKKV